MNAWRTKTVGYAQEQIDDGLRAYLVRVFNYMGMGLATTGLVAFFVSSNHALMSLFFTPPMSWLVLFSPLAIIFFLNFKIETLRFSTAKILFYTYASLLGISLSSIFLVYTGTSIARIFFTTGALFSSMALYGYTTNRDLSRIGSFLLMGLIGVIIAMIVNMFFQSSAFQMLLSVLSVIIFTGLTAYDMQTIKQLYYRQDNSEVMAKKALIGALHLYLDFINLFISLLRLFGERR